METTGVQRFLGVLRRRMAWVLGIALVATLTSGFLVFRVIKPQYTESTTLLVNQPLSNPQLIYDLVMANQQLVTTYAAIIQSNLSEAQVIAQLHLPYTPKQLSHMIKVTSPNGSQLIEIQATTPTPQESAQIANELAASFQKEVTHLMNVANVQVVDPAVVPPKPVPTSPKKTLTIAIATMLGLVLGAGVAYGVEMTDTRFKTEEEMRSQLGIPVLGVVSDYRRVAHRPKALPAAPLLQASSSE